MLAGMNHETVTPLFSNVADFTNRSQAAELFGAVVDRHGVPHDLSPFVRAKKIDLFAWQVEIVGFRFDHIQNSSGGRQPVAMDATRTLREDAIKALKSICNEWGRTSEVVRIEPSKDLGPRLCYKAACAEAMDTLRHYPH